MVHVKGALIEQYRELHRRRKVYAKGSTVRRYATKIAEIVHEIPTESILDYGCGRGWQYTIDGLHEAWGGIMPTLFDPGVGGLDRLPAGKFDGVICTGVLEHIPRAEVDQAIANLVRYARKWAVIVVGTGLSPNKRLPNGMNVHVLVKPKDWWVKRISEAFAGTGVRVWLACIHS